MARKDRRFTAEDVKRFYCKNLSPEDRAFHDMLECDWEDLTTLEKAIKLLELLNSPPVSYVWDLLPAGATVTILLDWIIRLLDAERLALPQPELPLLPGPPSA